MDVKDEIVKIEIKDKVEVMPSKTLKIRQRKNIHKWHDHEVRKLVNLLDHYNRNKPDKNRT